MRTRAYTLPASHTHAFNALIHCRYGLLASDSRPSSETVETTFDGNICRCDAQLCSTCCFTLMILAARATDQYSKRCIHLYLPLSRRKKKKCRCQVQPNQTARSRHPRGNKNKHAAHHASLTWKRPLVVFLMTSSHLLTDVSLCLRIEIAPFLHWTRFLFRVRFLPT